MNAFADDPVLYFYLDPVFWRDDVPLSADVIWSGFELGIYIWTVQTCLRLREAGVRCELTKTIPESGIVIAHRESLEAIDGKFAGRVLPTARRFVVEMTADLRPWPHANFHIVQNPVMAHLGRAFRHVRHWPQPELIPRDARRGSRFENIVYFGNAKNLARELRAEQWGASLAERGLHWQVRSKNVDASDTAHYQASSEWNDHRDVDAIIAVRSFTPGQTFDHKPASKLYNAWFAGVPAILGVESGYRAERRSELDYLEAASADEALGQVDRLRNSPELRMAMTENGRRRSAEVTAAATTRAWQALIANEIIPAYREWIGAGALRRGWISQRKQLDYQANRTRAWLQRRMR